VFESQVRFEHPDALRAWITVGAGHCFYAPGVDGVTVAVPMSINYESLDEPAFRAHHARCVGFLRSPAALVYLWPEARPGVAERHVEGLLIQCGDSAAKPEERERA